MDIKTLIAQHPQDVALLFKAYGYQMPVTLENTTNFFNVNGHKDLPFTGYTSDQKPKGKLWDILGKGLGVAGQVAGIINPKKYNNLQLNQNQPTPTDDRILGVNKTLFLSLCGLAALIIVIILFKQKK
jgi:hypothetical protein